MMFCRLICIPDKCESETFGSGADRNPEPESALLSVLRIAVLGIGVPLEMERTRTQQE